ncbi:MAG: hypothetical protein K8F30_07690, partial [Taibaiella sp.]|nr:hypothetical protein [Taibaiella sp.]
MNTDFEDKNAEEVERLADLVEKPKRGTAKQNNPNQKWSWLKVALPIIVAIIGALGLIIASGNGQVVVEIANSIFNNSDQPIMSTQVALALTQTSVKVIQDTASDATATHVAQLTPSPVPPSATLTATSTRTPTAPITPMPTGKLVYNDEFEDGLAHQFSFFAGSWKVIEETTDNKVLEAITDGGGANASFGTPNFTDGIIEYRFRILKVDYQAQHH